VVALARQRSTEEPDLVTDDVAARRAGDTQGRDAQLGGARAQKRSPNAGRPSPARRGRGAGSARLGGGRCLAAVPEGQETAQRPADCPEAMDSLGVDCGREREQRRHAAGDQVELARGVRARVAVGEMAANALGLFFAGDAGDIGVEVATQAPAALTLVVVVDEVAQACPPALSDLAELLHRPAKALAELVTVHAERYLAGDDEALIGAQLVGELAQATKVVARGHVDIDVGRWVSQLRERRRCF
jgi:hypothetical protein